MTGITAPPIFAPMVDESGKVTLPWLLFFNNLYGGDQGIKWSPSFTGLTETGAASFSGIYYQISKSLAYFAATISPVTDTSAVTASTYINNFPLQLKNDGACNAVSGFVGSTPGICQASSNRIYIPGWTAIPVPVTICGIVEAG